ncbi:MAG: hypothetical protein ACRDN1_10430 [Trebonia sp.]
MADTFFVPVRESGAGTLALQTGRLRSGERVGLAFSTEDSLLLTLGSSRRWCALAVRRSQTCWRRSGSGMSWSIRCRRAL